MKENITNSFGICFDIPHSYLSNEEKFLDIPDEVMRELKKRTGYIHLSGTDLERDQHYPLITEGGLPFDQVKSFLQDIKFSGTVNLELVPRTLDDIVKMFKSVSIMFNVAGKRSQSLLARMKIPLVLYRLKKYEKIIDAELQPVKAHYEN